MSCSLNVTDVRVRRQHPKKSPKALAGLAESKPKRKRAESNVVAGPSKKLRVRVDEPCSPSPPPTLNIGPPKRKRRAESNAAAGPSTAATDHLQVQAELFARQSSLVLFDTLIGYLDVVRRTAAKEIADIEAAAAGVDDKSKKRQSKSKGKGKERE